MKAKKLISVLLATLFVSSTAMFSACNLGANNSTDSSPSSGNASSDSSSSGSSAGGETVGEKEEEFLDSAITLCDNGTSAYKVVLPSGANASLQWAANELTTYVEKATGVKLPTVDEATLGNTVSTQDKLISLGKTDLLASAGITVTKDEVTTDGYKIINRDNTVFICGCTDWGTSFGTLEFLHHQVGYESYTADEIAYDINTGVMKLKDFGTYVDVPAFDARSMDGIAHYDMETSYRNRLIGLYLNGEERYGGNKKSDWIPGPDHTIHLILPETEYKDFYNPSTQMCYSRDDLLEIITQRLITLIQANPDGYIVNVGAEDGKAYCACDVCQEEISKYKVSGYFMRFMNKLINNLETWREENCPERELVYCSFAYGGTLAPPVEELNGKYEAVDPSVIPHEKMYIKITTGSCLLHSVYDENCPTNVNFRKYFYGWNAICPRLMVWDYAANYVSYLPFHDDISHIQSLYSFYKEMNVVNIFVETNSGGQFTSFGFLREYLRAKCMWNPEQNIEELIDNFFEAYYKDAAPLVRQVFDLYRTHWAAVDATNITGHQTVSSLVYLNTTMWPRNIVDQAVKLLKQALVVCDNMENVDAADKVRTRVEEELLCAEVLQVLFYDDYGYDMNEREAFIAAFEQKTIDMNVTHYSEHQSMANFIAGKKKA